MGRDKQRAAINNGPRWTAGENEPPVETLGDAQAV